MKDKYPEQKAPHAGGHLCLDGQLVISNFCKKPFDSAKISSICNKYRKKKQSAGKREFFTLYLL